MTKTTNNMNENPEKFCGGVEVVDGNRLLLCPNPYCGDTGGYPVEDGDGGWEQCQCEFCWTVENSFFNYKEKLKKVQDDTNNQYICHEDCSHVHREKLLGQALLNVLVKCGMLREDSTPTGPELLMFAEQFTGEDVSNISNDN